LFTGSPRVPGDEEEEDTDDLEQEFSIDLHKEDKHHEAEELPIYDGDDEPSIDVLRDPPHHVMMHQKPSMPQQQPLLPQYPLLTNGQSVIY
jgi:cellulose synthase A